MVFLNAKSSQYNRSLTLFDFLKISFYTFEAVNTIWSKSHIDMFASEVASYIYYIKNYINYIKSAVIVVRFSGVNMLL